MTATRMGYLARSVLTGFMATVILAQAGASLAQGRGSFDHLRTNFPLTGVHAITPCETCHVGGQMAGTPAQCEYCHRAGSRIATTTKPARHVQTAESCDACHRSSVTWAGARFSHVAIAPGACFSCHNGGTASGKPANHVMTTASCDTCHRTAAWLPATFSHASVTPGTCASCHNGARATGKPANHVVTTATCDLCHRTTAWLPATFSHANVTPGTCATCHNGTTAKGKPTNHIPHESQLLAGSSMGCDACHTSTTSFTIQRMNHNNSLGNGSGWCKGCHASGTSYLGNMQKKSLTHQSKSGVTDCSQSGCHRPLGNRGSNYKSW